MIIRVCAAVLRRDQILMVRHSHDGREYWTLPGGGVDAGETPEAAAAREVLEETGLVVEIGSPLCDSPFKDGLCRCFLAKCDSESETALGYDPEEAHLPQEQRMLREVAWHTLSSQRHDIQVSQVIAALAISD